MQLYSFCILVLAASLVQTSPPEQCNCEEKANTCTIVAGINGLPGMPGNNGLPGRDGIQGPKGEQGEQGLRGTPGPSGKAGPPGSKGNQGERGEKGDSGGKAIVGHIFPNSTKAGEKTFVANGAEGDFETTKAMCSHFGGQMASPRNEEENQATLKLATALRTHAFLGMNDQETEGEFKHLNGDPMEYSNWAPAEPNGSHEDCIELYLNGKWNDNVCDKNRLIVCEFKFTGL